MKKKTFTREEKIAYYTKRIQHAQKRIEYLQSDDYQEQDWSTRIPRQVQDARINDLIKVVEQLARKVGA